MSTGKRIIRTIEAHEWRIPDDVIFRKEIMVVLGNSPSMSSDIGMIQRLGFINSPIMAINDAGLFIKGLEHLASQHIEKISDIRYRRAEKGLNTDFIGHSIGEYEGVDRIWPLEVSNGSSGLFGVITALKLGYNVIVAGISLTGNFGEYYGTDENNHPNKHKQYDMFRITWEQIKPHFNDRVRAVSGYPREILGFPDGDWLLKVLFS